jgi:hypothetical protein
MEFSKPELKTLLALALARLPDGAAPLAPVLAGHRREEEARATLEALQRANFITVDWLAGKARLLESNLAAVLLGAQPAPAEMFHTERPLDAPLDAVCRTAAFPHGADPPAPNPRAESARNPRRAESAPRIDSNRTRDKSTVPSSSNRSAESARAYIEEKLAQPEMFHVLKEVTGGIAHMQQSFTRLFEERPERLAELIGEAAQPHIRKKARWLNTALSRELQTPQP